MLNPDMAEEPVARVPELTRIASIKLNQQA
jgi:hypothetical protein